MLNRNSDFATVSTGKRVFQNANLHRPANVVNGVVSCVRMPDCNSIVAAFF